MAFVTLTLMQALAMTKSLNGHARSCKKSPDACKPCQQAIAWYAGLPLGLLAEVLQDRPTNHTA